jgi:toxin ParE1/3/4
MRIRWTEPAARDLTGICDYIQKHGSSTTTRRIAISIYDRVGTLADFPESGRAGRKRDTRELIISGLPYVAIYRIREGTIEILRILHGAQDWP